MRAHPTPPTIVFTDLDHTLLDARGALPAGKAVRRVWYQGIPVIPATSKTAAETLALLRAWGLPLPAVVENGAVICLPAGNGRWRMHRLTAITYARLRYQIRRLRQALGFQLPGFGDWTLRELVQATGLSPPQALAARQRLASEPLLCAGDPPPAFLDGLREGGLQAIAGGRFLTVLPAGADKAVGARRLLRAWRPFASRPRIVALGDAPNDRRLLAFADLAACLPGPQPVREAPCLHARRAGPEGWLEALQQLGVLK